MQQARVNAEAEREAERERHERERRDAAERELRGRAEALILAVAAVRNLPEKGSRGAAAYSVEHRREVEGRVYPALVAVGAMHPSLWSVAAEVESKAHAGIGEFGPDEHFEEAVDRLLEAVEAALRVGR